MELPGFGEPAFEAPEVRKGNTKPRQGKNIRQEQLDLLAALGPTDISGLPAWVNDENTDLTGLPIWR